MNFTQRTARFVNAPLMKSLAGRNRQHLQPSTRPLKGKGNRAMNRVCTLALLVLLIFPFSAQSQNITPTDDLVAMGAYVATDDIDRSEKFYRQIFEREPTIRLDDFVAFDVAGGWFAIVSRKKYAPGSVSGTGAVPYIQSGDLEKLQARAVAATGGRKSEIIVEPGIRLLKIHDPDGQLVEFFSFTGG